MRALVFDFDGLILDTESTDFESWRRVYEEHGQVLPRDRWQLAIGGAGDEFRPFDHLQELLGRALPEPQVRAVRRHHHRALIAELEPMPGLLDWLRCGRDRGLRLAVASSSPASWVEEHLARIGLAAAFELLMTADRVQRVKPHPELYRRALEELDVDPREALAVEDSPKGVTAAKAAGLPCIAVPGPMTRGLGFDHADLVLESLAEASLEDALERLL